MVKNSEQKSGRPPVVIKKYANRRLYNTQSSAYVTLEDLAAMVKNGDDFVVQDAKTGEDITRQVLTQIIFELENQGKNLLPISFLRQLIRFYGDSMQMLVPGFLDMSLQNFAQQKDRLASQFGKAFGAPLAAFEEQARQNIRMFEKTFSAFMPYAQNRNESANAKENSGEIENLRAQLASMQEKLDKLLKQKS